MQAKRSISGETTSKAPQLGHLRMDVLRCKDAFMSFSGHPSASTRRRSDASVNGARSRCARRCVTVPTGPCRWWRWHRSMFTSVTVTGCGRQRSVADSYRVAISDLRAGPAVGGDEPERLWIKRRQSVYGRCQNMAIGSRSDHLRAPWQTRKANAPLIRGGVWARLASTARTRGHEGASPRAMVRLPVIAVCAMAHIRYILGMV